MLRVQVWRRDIRGLHARRVGWRILKDWIEAQMALLETEMVEFDQVFLAYMVINKTQNLYEYMLESGFQVALPPGQVANA